MSEAAVIPRRLNDTPSSSQGCILIIDDEVEIRESLQTLLEFEGYEVDVAENGEEGIAKLGDRSFDLVLLDLALPGRSGIEILPDIRSLDPQISIIMITAYGDPETKRKAIEGGAEGLLTKPIDFTLLREEIDTRLERAG